MTSESCTDRAEAKVFTGFYLCDTRRGLAFYLAGFCLSNDCTICKYTRYFFYAAVPIVILIGMGGGPGVAPSLQSITVDLGDYLAIGILIALFSLITFRAYIEYYVPWRDGRDAEASRAQGTRTDDECKHDAAADQDH